MLLFVYLHSSATHSKRIRKQHGGAEGVGGEIVLETHLHGPGVDGSDDDLLDLVGGGVVGGDALVPVPLAVTGV